MESGHSEFYYKWSVDKKVWSNLEEEFGESLKAWAVVNEDGRKKSKTKVRIFVSLKTYAKEFGKNLCAKCECRICDECAEWAFKNIVNEKRKLIDRGSRSTRPKSVETLSRVCNLKDEQLPEELVRAYEDLENLRISIYMHDLMSLVGKLIYGTLTCEIEDAPTLKKGESFTYMIDCLRNSDEGSCEEKKEIVDQNCESENNCLKKENDIIFPFVVENNLVKIDLRCDRCMKEAEEVYVTEYVVGANGQKMPLFAYEVAVEARRHGVRISNAHGMFTKLGFFEVGSSKSSLYDRVHAFDAYLVIKVYPDIMKRLDDEKEGTSILLSDDQFGRSHRIIGMAKIAWASFMCGITKMCTKIVVYAMSMIKEKSAISLSSIGYIHLFADEADEFFDVSKITNIKNLGNRAVFYEIKNMEGLQIMVMDGDSMNLKGYQYLITLEDFKSLEYLYDIWHNENSKYGIALNNGIKSLGITSNTFHSIFSSCLSTIHEREEFKSEGLFDCLYHFDEVMMYKHFNIPEQFDIGKMKSILRYTVYSNYPGLKGQVWKYCVGEEFVFTYLKLNDWINAAVEYSIDLTIDLKILIGDLKPFQHKLGVRKGKTIVDEVVKIFDDLKDTEIENKNEREILASLIEYVYRIQYALPHTASKTYLNSLSMVKLKNILVGMGIWEKLEKKPKEKTIMVNEIIKFGGDKDSLRWGAYFQNYLSGTHKRCQNFENLPPATQRSISRKKTETCGKYCTCLLHHFNVWGRCGKCDLHRLRHGFATDVNEALHSEHNWFSPKGILFALLSYFAQTILTCFGKNDRVMFLYHEWAKWMGYSVDEDCSLCVKCGKDGEGCRSGFDLDFHIQNFYKEKDYNLYLRKWKCSKDKVNFGNEGDCESSAED